MTEDPKLSLYEIKRQAELSEKRAAELRLAKARRDRMYYFGMFVIVSFLCLLAFILGVVVGLFG